MRAKPAADAHPEAACADLALVLPHPDLADAHRVSARAILERRDARQAQLGVAHTLGHSVAGPPYRVPVSGHEQAAHMPGRAPRDMDGGDNSSRAHSNPARRPHPEAEAEAADSR